MARDDIRARESVAAAAHRAEQHEKKDREEEPDEATSYSRFLVIHSCSRV